jgi:hypothetical protein
MLQEGEHFGIALQVRHIFADHVESHKEERKADGEFA